MGKDSHDVPSAADLYCTLYMSDPTGRGGGRSTEVLMDRPISNPKVCQNLTEQFAMKVFPGGRNAPTSPDSLVGTVTDNNTGNVLQSTKCIHVTSTSYDQYSALNDCKTVMFKP